MLYYTLLTKVATNVLCVTVGTYVKNALGKKGGRVTYPETTAHFRTDVSFRSRINPNHHVSEKEKKKLKKC